MTAHRGIVWVSNEQRVVQVVRDFDSSFTSVDVPDFDSRIPPRLTPERRKRRALALSERERQVLRLLACGHTVPAVAGKLDLSVETVRTHSKSVYAKLGVANAAGAATSAILQGLVDIKLTDLATPQL